MQCFSLSFICPVFHILRGSTSMRRIKMTARNLALTSVMLCAMFVMVAFNSPLILVKAVVKTFLRFLTQ
ncbi:hypothetical protein ALQ39_200069 [Pseudomonas amygdali pv. eriobotryae]|uniref:Uncharacterized protein n=1 Tax=Pseudomonas amygdali pv. eriobotryae TaxID=129137 RepID=A0A3M3VT55_PSEA0|nr:hypothetical protein ALQ39_200069 [Pseudomonas amygdali pv. eriobotryae]